MRTFRWSALINLSIIVVGLIVFGLVFFRLNINLKNQANEINFKRFELESNLNAINSLSRLKNEAAQAEIYKNKMEFILPTSDRLIEFSRFLDSLARVRQISFNFNFQGEPVAPKENQAGYINFGLTLVGNLEKLVAFIKDLETSPQFLADFKDFDLQKTGADELRQSLSGRLYFR